MTIGDVFITAAIVFLVVAIIYSWDTTRNLRKIDRRLDELDKHD